MKTWQKIALLTLAVLLIAGARIYFVIKDREDPGVAARNAAKQAPRPSMDDLAVVRQLLLTSFDDAKQLEGKSVWVKAGYSLPYYPFADGKVDFAKRVGVLPSAEKLEVAKLVKAVAPAKEDNRVPHGSRQYFAVFALPGKTALFAAPIGFAQGSDETLFCDQLFYYDDPHKIYDNWPKPVWDAVAAHEPTVGMSENQVRMAVGILLQSGSTSIGNRTVTYDAGGKSWTVTFVKNAATEVKAASSAG